MNYASFSTYSGTIIIIKIETINLKTIIREISIVESILPTRELVMIIQIDVIICKNRI